MLHKLYKTMASTLKQGQYLGSQTGFWERQPRFSVLWTTET